MKRYLMGQTANGAFVAREYAMGPWCDIDDVEVEIAKLNTALADEIRRRKVAEDDADRLYKASMEYGRIMLTDAESEAVNLHETALESRK